MRKTIEQYDTAITRWKTRLRRAMTAIDKLEQQRKRAVKVAALPPKPAFNPDNVAGYHPDQSEAERIKRGPSTAPKPVKKEPDDLVIPTFLQRKPLDPIAADIKAEQDRRKKAKSRARIERMKLKKSGDLKKMPLTGKAALEAIRNA